MHKKYAKVYDEKLEYENFGTLKDNDVEKKNHREFVALGGGVFLHDLFSSIRRYIQAPTAEKVKRIEEYSGHDFTVTALLANLESVVMRWPPYATNIVLEYWHKPSGSGCPQGAASVTSPTDYWPCLQEYWIRIYFNGEPLQIRNEYCNFAAGCRLDKFVGHLETRIINNFHGACDKTPDPTAYGIKGSFVLKPYTADGGIADDDEGIADDDDDTVLEPGIPDSPRNSHHGSDDEESIMESRGTPDSPRGTPDSDSDD